MVLGFDFARACGKLAIWTRAPHIGLAIGTQLGFLCTSDAAASWFTGVAGIAGFAVTNRCHDAFVAPTNDKIIAAIAVRPTDTRGGHAIRGAATHVV